MAWETDIAQGAADTIAAGSFSPAIAASRVSLDVRDREDIDGDVTATVYPAEQAVGLGSRSSFERNLTIAVVLQARVEDFDNTTIDPLCDLVDQVIVLFLGKHLAGYAAAVCLRVERPALFDPERLYEHHIFEAEIRLMYRLYTTT